MPKEHYSSTNNYSKSIANNVGLMTICGLQGRNNGKAAIKGAIIVRRRLRLDHYGLLGS